MIIVTVSFRQDKEQWIRFKYVEKRFVTRDPDGPDPGECLCCLSFVNILLYYFKYKTTHMFPIVILLLK